MEVVGQLAAGTVHDLNNLLTVILGFSGLMTVALGEDAPLRADAEAIRVAAERATAITRRLLVFSRKGVVSLVGLDLNDVVSSLDKMLRQLVDDTIVLNIVGGESVARVKADAGHLGQVLLNLVVNARDALPGGGTITVSTSNADADDNQAHSAGGAAPARFVLLAVSDTGMGMNDDVQSRLFQAFFTTKPEGQGTGLGLATRATIVKLCGGHISVASEVGRGTTVKVYLAAVGGPPEVAAPGSAA